MAPDRLPKPPRRIVWLGELAAGHPPRLQGQGCQLAKLARCPEVQETIAACVGTAARGAALPLTGAALAIVDRLLEVVVSERGSSLVALAVSVAAREGTASLVSSLHQAVLSALSGAAAAPAPAAPPPPAAPAVAAAAAAPPPLSPGLANAAGAAVAGALSLLQRPAGERLMQSVVSSGVGGAVGACLESTAGVDVYSPMLAAFSRPEHRQALTELAAAMSGVCCREMWAAACDYPGAAAGGAARWAAQGRVVDLEAEAPLEASAPAGQQHAGQSSGAPLRGASRSSSSGSLAAGGSAGASPPNTPQSGPTTPEPSRCGGPFRRSRCAGAAAARPPSSSSCSGSSNSSSSPAARRLAAVCAPLPVRRSAAHGRWLTSKA